jgi:thioredoxin 1
MVRPASCSKDVQFADCASLGHLLEFADLMHKPVFLYFYAPWIESCQRMDQYVYTQDDLAAYFNNHFINYKINAGGNYPEAEIADRYGITTFPTLLFVDGKGKIMKRHEGPATVAQVLEMGYYLQHAVEKEMVSIGSED